MTHIFLLLLQLGGLLGGVQDAGEVQVRNRGRVHHRNAGVAARHAAVLQDKTRLRREAEFTLGESSSAGFKTRSPPGTLPSYEDGEETRV